MTNVAILIPAYNEALTIKKVITDFSKKLTENDKIFVYNNNSTDNTLEIIEELKNKNEFKDILVIKNEFVQGKGNVIRRMFREIDAKYYVLVDADDTYFADDLDKLLYLVKNKNVDMAVGDRLSSTYFLENKRAFHNFGNNLVKFFINIIFHKNIKDIMTGYRCMSYNFVKTFPVLSKGFEVETEMTIHALQYNMSIETVVINYKDRVEGSFSKLNTYSDGFKVLYTIFKLYKNNKPFSFFGFLSILLFVFSQILFVPILIYFLNTGFVPKIPTLLVSLIIFLISIITFFTGVMLQSFSDESKKNFEFKLNILQNKFNEI